MTNIHASHPVKQRTNDLPDFVYCMSSVIVVIIFFVAAKVWLWRTSRPISSCCLPPGSVSMLVMPNQEVMVDSEQFMTVRAVFERIFDS